MANVLKISGLVLALLAMAALLAAGARADWVTTADCKARGVRQRIRRYPTDRHATHFAMNGCSLTEINQGYQDIFTGLPNLETIDLDYNLLENINPVAFHTVPTLTKLWLSRNKLREVRFDERSCPNLTKLYLFSNQLSRIENERTFSDCAKLTRLFLSGNHIDFIHPNAFKHLTELEYLHLDHNKIRSIPDQMFVSNGKLEQLDLTNNRITHLSPDFASSLKRTSTGLESFYFHDNPWHCACLLELLTDVRKSDVSYYCASCYDGNLPVCVHINASRNKCRDIRELSGLSFERALLISSKA